MVVRYAPDMQLASVSSALTNPGFRLSAIASPANIHAWNKPQSMGNHSTRKGTIQWD